ncbi:MAG TPA: YARHG domain-containing protein [Pyrinomonadaceae bacterium]|nr:YARHG domain-containing protein [Pyrinomonadaceae bacterium]
MSDRAKHVEEKILRGEALSNNDLADLSAYELRVLRNVHFARYGRKYEQPGLGDYFFTRPWYKASETYTDTALTATDKANISLIVEAEKQIGSSTVASNSSFSNTTSSQTSVTTATSNSPADRLTNGNVEEAVRRMLSNLTQGGSVMVQGVQELPQENAAVADLVFNQFKYAADQYGTPVAASKYNPKPLPRNRIPTPEEMFQPRLRTYSGTGRAVLKHYNNNQWTLKQVNWGGMGIGWQGNVVVR